MTDRTIFVLSPEVDPAHRRAHRLVATGEAQEVRIENKDGYLLFRAWDHGSTTQYAWQTSQMAAPAFWPRLTLADTHPCPIPGCDTGSVVDHQVHPE